MKRLILIACVLFLAGCGGSSGPPTPVADYAGNWFGNWGSSAWEGNTNPGHQQSGTIILDINSAGAITQGKFYLGKTISSSTLVRTITSGQLVAGGMGTFTVLDNTTNTTYSGVAPSNWNLNGPKELDIALETTNSSGVLQDYITAGLNPQPSAAIKNR